MKRNIVIPAAVTAVLLLVISGVRESRYTYETQPGGCVQVQGGGFAGRQYPGGMSMGTGTGGGLLFWVDQGGPELELTAEFFRQGRPGDCLPGGAGRHGRNAGVRPGRRELL